MDGRACRAWAVRDSDSPLCATHGGRPAGVADDVVPQHSESNDPAATAAATAVGDAAASAVEQDRSAPDLEEVALLVNLALDDGLEDEVAASRVAVQRVMEELREELSPAEFARLAGLVFRGSDTIARLLRAQRELSGDAADGLAGAISEALDGLGDEWGLEL
jgi:soluble lytic murein transglycosylase-like protein